MGELSELAVPVEIGAGVPRMAQECLPGPHQRADRGGAHAGKLAFALGLADDGVMRGHNGGLHHAGDRLDVATGVVLLDVGQ